MLRLQRPRPPLGKYLRHNFIELAATLPAEPVALAQILYDVDSCSAVEHVIDFFLPSLTCFFAPRRHILFLVGV
jgi:hypothetical protein